MPRSTPCSIPSERVWTSYGVFPLKLHAVIYTVYELTHVHVQMHVQMHVRNTHIIRSIPITHTSYTCLCISYALHLSCIPYISYTVYVWPRAKSDLRNFTYKGAAIRHSCPMPHLKPPFPTPFHTFWRGVERATACGRPPVKWHAAVFAST